MNHYAESKQQDAATREAEAFEEEMKRHDAKCEREEAQEGAAYAAKAPSRQASHEYYMAASAGNLTDEQKDELFKQKHNGMTRRQYYEGLRICQHMAWHDTYCCTTCEYCRAGNYWNSESAVAVIELEERHGMTGFYRPDQVIRPG
jgi:hypothetical protein